MRLLAWEFTQRADRAPDEVAVIDPLGEHTVGEVMEAARELAVALGEALTGAPTVLVQADNTWRTLATALAVGLRGGVVTVFSSHAAASEFALAMEDVEPDAVIAADDVLTAWSVPAEAFPDKRAVLDGWTLATTGGPASDVGRWAGGAAIAMTSGSTGRPKCVVQSEDALRYAGRCTIDAVGLEPGDAVGAFVPLSSVAAFCFGMYLPAMLGAPMVCIDAWKPDDALEAMAARDVRWTMLVPARSPCRSPTSAPAVPGPTGRAPTSRLKLSRARSAVAAYLSCRRSRSGASSVSGSPGFTAVSPRSPRGGLRASQVRTSTSRCPFSSACSSPSTCTNRSMQRSPALTRSRAGCKYRRSSGPPTDGSASRW